MIEVTENWSGDLPTLAFPLRAQKEFLVSGTSDAAQALAAVDPSTGVRVYQRGDGHPMNTQRLRCSGPEVVRKEGPEFWVIRCPFELDQGNFTDDDPDPLKLPTLITWSPAIATFPADHDLDNRVKANSAGQVFQGGQRTVRYKQLTLVKNLLYYDLAMSRDYEGAVNSKVVTLSGAITVAVQHMFCVSIAPAIANYPPNSPFLPIAFVFDIYPEGILGAYPFQEKFLDCGQYGWYDKSGTKTQGRFVNALGDPIDDVRLDGTGLPLTKTSGGGVMIGSPEGGGNFTPVTPPHAGTAYQKEYYSGAGGNPQASLKADTEATFLYFKEARIVDFSPLLELF